MSATRWLVLEAGQARLAASRPAALFEITIDPARSEVEARELVSRVCDKLDDEIWKLELSGLAAMSLRPAILYALALHEEGSGAVQLPEEVCEKTAAGVLTVLGGNTRNAWRDYVLQALAGLMGWFTLLMVFLRYGGSKAQSLPSGTDPLFASHGENTTRTRHLVNLAAYQQNPVILILGRPRGDVASALASLNQKGQLVGARAVRPLSLLACFLGFVPGFVRVLRGAREIRSSGLAPDFRTRLAMSYRVMQGAAHAAWWSRTGLVEQKVLFGHTGTADTSLLEGAMQATGCETVHVVHGTGLGWPFAGLSDLALFQSGHDADMAATLPGYGHCTHLEMPQPALAEGDEQWLLLTSYTHPLNPDYVTRGSATDVSIVRWVAQVAKALGQAPDHIIWRPHPMLGQTAPKARVELEQAVTRAGFASWPEDSAYEDMARFGTVITTPSTSLTDALRLGVVPVLCVAAPLQKDLVYSAYPVVARDYAELHAALSELQDSACKKARFAQAWMAIHPSAPFRLDAIQEVLLRARA